MYKWIDSPCYIKCQWFSLIDLVSFQLCKDTVATLYFSSMMKCATWQKITCVFVVTLVFSYWPSTHKHPKLTGQQAPWIHLVSTSPALLSHRVYTLNLYVCLEDQMQNLILEKIRKLIHFPSSINNLVLHKIMYPISNHKISSLIK